MGLMMGRRRVEEAKKRKEEAAKQENKKVKEVAPNVGSTTNKPGAKQNSSAPRVRK